MRQQCGRALKSAHLSYWKSLCTRCGLKSTELSIETIHAQTKSLVAIILMEPMYFVEPRHVRKSIRAFALRHTPTAPIIITVNRSIGKLACLREALRER